jgi:amidase/aspartyl-tRNA(Asn)/glutamyl-tRNA(Gln) amidotransferase subunit A
MTFADWQALDPTPAAREFLRRATTLIPPAQQRAVFAHLPTEAELVTHFATAPADAPLAGVPYLAKDLYDVAGFPTFAGSTFLPEVRPEPTVDSTLVTALNAAGAVLAGKTHLHEFAYGITGENPHYGDCEHPRFPGRTTGGSSSGSAAAVAAGIVPLALGTDTGGSVRVPAAFCGLFGYRGKSRDPWIADAFPLSPTFDTAGWFTGTAGDMRTALAALVGLGTSERAPRGCYLEIPGLSPEVAAACATAAARLAPPADQATRGELLRRFAGALDAYNIIVATESAAIHAPWSAGYKDRYDPAVWARLQRVHELTDAQVASADATLATVRLVWTSYFLTFDFLILPAVHRPALTKTDCTLPQRSRLLSFTAPASLGGLPVLTVPVALNDGLTAGLQIVVNNPQSPVLPWALANF